MNTEEDRIVRDIWKLRKLYAEQSEKLRHMQLRVVAAAVLQTEKAPLLNVGASSVSVAECSERVLEDLRPFSRHLLHGVADIIKGGARDGKGVLELATCYSKQPESAIVKALRVAMLRALVEKRVRSLGKRAWVTQLLSMFVGVLSTSDILSLFKELGRDNQHVIEITRHDVNVAKTRQKYPGMPVPVTARRRHCREQWRKRGCPQCKIEGKR